MGKIKQLARDLVRRMKSMNEAFETLAYEQCRGTPAYSQTIFELADRPLLAESGHSK